MPCWMHAHHSTVLHSADRVNHLCPVWTYVPALASRAFASVHSYLLVDTPNAAPSSNLDSCFCIVIYIGRYIYVRAVYISAKICTGGGLGMAVSYRIQIRRCRVLLLSSTVPKPSHSVVTRQMQKMERTYVQARRSIYSTIGLQSPLLCCMPLGSGNQYTCTLQPTGSSILVFYMCVIFCT